MSEVGWTKSKTDTFHVTFLGDAVKEHDIDANDLATSLMGISEVIEQSNKILFGETYSEVYIKVKGDFKPGSFWITMAVILTSTNFEAVVNLLSVLGFCGFDIGSLIQAFKKTKGGKIVHKEKISGDQYHVQVNNGGTLNSFTFNAGTVNLLEDKKIQKGMNQIARVFQNQGISEIQFSGVNGDTPLESISRGEAGYFRVSRRRSRRDKNR